MLWDKVKQCHQLSFTWFRKSGVVLKEEEQNRFSKTSKMNLAKPHTVLTVLFFKTFWKLKNIQIKRENNLKAIICWEKWYLLK